MLCPEVWNFEAPHSIFQVEKGNVEEQTRCIKTINNFYYSHLVSIVLPGTRSNPQHLIDSLITDCDYYKIANLSIVEFIKKDFIDNFIKGGNCAALSIGQRVDCDDCVSVTPTGKIVLSLSKESYESLGLEGRVSKFCHKTKARYIVHVDLLAEHFQPSKSIYKRIKARLEGFSKFHFIISWNPRAKNVCPSSIAKYFSDLNYDVKLCQPEFKRRTAEMVDLPEMCASQEFVEWLGAFSVNADLSSSDGDNYLSSFETPQPSSKLESVDYLQWRGFFTSVQIKALLSRLVCHLNKEKRPWISLHVQGFSDSPINWSLNEHHYFVNGDNSYTIVVNSTNYMLFKLMCSNKYYKK